MTDQIDSVRNINLLAALTRVSPISDEYTFNTLCEEYDFTPDAVTFFFVPKPEQKLVTSMMMEPIDLLVLDSEGMLSYHGDDLIVSEEEPDHLLAHLNLYQKLF